MHVEGKAVVAKPGKRTVYKRREADRLQFIEWLALPTHLRDPATQNEFATMIKANRATISSWKREPGFLDAVRDRANEIARENHSDVIRSLMSNIRAGDTAAIRIYFDYLQDMKPKEEIKAEIKEAGTPDEIRARILERLAALGITRRS